MKLTPRRFLSCVWEAGVSMMRHDGVEHAGYLAFLVHGIKANWRLPYLSPGLPEAYAGSLFHCYSRP
jgi:hypothetical protein